MRIKAGFIPAVLKNNAVTVIAALAAIITMFFVPPDEKYLEYFDFKTLTCLFCVLAMVCALRNIRFFYTLAKAIVRRFRNAKICVLALVYITFIGSMLIANDMALLTFLPLGYFILHTTGAIPATEDDYYAEYLDLKLAVRTVDGVKAAVDHINCYGSRHSDGILSSAAMHIRGTGFGSGKPSD